MKHQPLRKLCGAGLLPKAHPRATTVFVDELHPGLLNRFPEPLCGVFPSAQFAVS